uniref:Uncharacterized protein n=1 Tax=Anguilla anguilla TaxID=7936 RepID=A0A0E9V5G7_ANGAN
MLLELLPVPRCWPNQSLTAAAYYPAASLMCSCTDNTSCMATFFAFHITNKFVLSLSHCPLLDNLTDVLQR